MATIEARIKRVYQDERDWYHVETDHPSVDDLRTKRVDKAREAKQWADSGDTLLIEYKHQQRPKEGGGFWDNYYFETARTVAAQSSNGGGSDAGIERVGGTTSTASAPIASGRKSDPAEAWRICLSVGCKAAVDSLRSGLDDPTFPGQTRLALAWATFLYTTPVPSALGAPADAPSSAPPGAYSDSEFGSDDDIPF